MDRIATDTGFDYTALDPDTQTVVIVARDRIRAAGRRAAEQAIEIGTELALVKEALPHGSFLPWIRAEFGWTDRTAQKFIRIAETFGKSEVTSDLGVEALYALSGPDVSDEVRTELLELAKLGPVRLKDVLGRIRLIDVTPKPERDYDHELVRYEGSLVERGALRARLMAERAPWASPVSPVPQLPIVDLETGAVVDDLDIQTGDAPYDPDEERRGWIAEQVQLALARLSGYRTDAEALDRCLAGFEKMAWEGSGLGLEEEGLPFDAYVALSIVAGRMDPPADW